jgi:hypothetical protein
VTESRPELPEAPARIARLPLHRGYPVPWFVAWLDSEQEPLPRGQGTPDFRVLHPGAREEAHRFGLCWICGGPLAAHRAFVVGPMCAVNRTSAEPPSHLACAEYAVKACPFLVRPGMRRREAGLPDELEEMPGIALMRNPGVTLIWVTRRYRLRQAPNGTLFDIGEPASVAFYAHGRPASREEIEASIDSGLPSLQELAEAQGPYAVRYLERQVAKAKELLPVG